MSAERLQNGSTWCVGGRYEVRERVGAGSFGVVYRAEDTVTGDEVAVKLFDTDAKPRTTRVWREAAVLRRLNLPGVVRLLDEGRDDGGTYLVMPFADGEPFPGPAERWQANQNTIIISLIELLSWVHGAGIVHGDLKPQNVLVDARGRVTLLDFGTGSWVSGLSSEEQLSRMQGTPAYMAPEQLRGRPATFHSDYYALGVMLFQVFTGAFPHPTHSLVDLVRERVNGALPRIDAEAAHISPKLARAVEGLLATVPERRVQHLEELVAALDCDRSLSLMAQRLPYLDPNDVVGRAVAALERGESVDIVGRRGMGRSRCLEEVSRRLRENGRRVISLIASDEPLASLSPLVGRHPGEEASSPDEAANLCRALLREALEDAKIIVADNYEMLDTRTRELLDDERHLGGVVCARKESVDRGLQLDALSAEQLAEIFDGPEPIFCLRSEAARQLWLRTGGVARSVARQIDLWVRHGLAHFRGDRVVVPPQQLERLRRGLQLQPAIPASDATEVNPKLRTLAVWCQLAGKYANAEFLAPLMGRSRESVEAQLDNLVDHDLAKWTADGTLILTFDALAASPYSPARLGRIHKRLADGLKPGTPGRLLHLLRAGEDADVVTEGRAAAAYHERRGETGLAIAALREAIHACRDFDAADATYALFSDWTKCALASEETPRIEELLHAIDRAVDSGVARMLRLQRLVEAARAASQSPGEDVLAQLDAIEPFADVALELRRQMYRARVSERLPLTCMEQVVGEVETWVRRDDPGPEALGSLVGWQAKLAYLRGDFALASELNIRAAKIKERPSGKLASIISAVITMMDSLQYRPALEHAEAALARSERLQRHRDQVWCHYLLRSLRYRLDEPVEASQQFDEALEMFGSLKLSALCWMIDAAVAFRQGQLDLANEYVQRSYENFERAGDRIGEALSGALALRCRQESAPNEAQRFAVFARSCSAPRIAVQILGLLLGAHTPRRPEWVEWLRERAASVPKDHWNKRLEVISVDEAMAAADAYR